MKKIIASILLLAMVIAMAPAALAADTGLSNFTTTQTYVQGQFSDVAAGQWYTNGVKKAYELGLMKGGAGTSFNINGNITIAETLAMACRLNSIYNGGDGEFEQGSPWYQVYVDYAIEKGIITAGQFTNYTAKATRTDFVAILSKCLPESAFAQKNNVTAIPDVSLSDSYADSIYMFYNAGILGGSDDYGTFNPKSNIQRSEVAAIVTRIADVTERKDVTLKVDVTEVTLNKTSLELTTGKSEKLIATVAPENATDTTVTWSTSNATVATVSSDGTVTGGSAGTATITAKVGSKSATCTVTVTTAPISYSGKGDTVITGVNIPAGSYYAEYVHTGKSNFQSKLYYGNESYEYFRISNEIGVCSGQVALYDNGNAAITDGMLEVKADGDWTITFKPVSGTTTTNVKGSGQIVTGVFTATTSRVVVSTTHSGESNFIVKIIKYNGTKTYDYESVTNEIGNYSGQKIINLTKGTKYYIYVRADGDWTVDLGLGDTVTTYTRVSTSIAGSGSSSGSGSTDDGKYSYSDAYSMNQYAAQATSYANKGLEYVVKGMKASSSMKFTYYKLAQNYAGYAAAYEKKVIDILSTHVELTCTDGETVLYKAQTAYDLLNELSNITLTADNVSDYASTIRSNLSSGGTYCLAVQKATVELLGAFI